MNTGDSSDCYQGDTGTTPAVSSVKPNRTRQKHGLTNTVRGRYKADLSQIDGRSILSRTIQEWQGELVASLGGREVLSAQQIIMIDMVVKDRLAIESIETWLAGQPPLVNKRRRSLYPVVQQLSQLKDGMTRRLIALGLERRSRPLTSLRDILSAPQGNDQTQPKG